jgi:hypothetical protein
MATNIRDTRHQWYAFGILLALSLGLLITVGAVTAAPQDGAPPANGKAGVASPGNPPGAQNVAGCIPDRDYTFITSTAASLIPGTALVANSQCDDCTTQVTSPFAISFYGVLTTSLNVSSNGNAQLTSNNSSRLNVCLPTTILNNAIMPYWDDIDLRTSANASCPGGVCGIFTSVTGPAGTRIFTVEWRGVLFGTTTAVDFEINFHENDPNNQIDFVYGATGNGGLGATVGIQQGTGTKFSQVSCNTASLVNGEQVTFVQIPCGAPTFTPSATITSTPSNTPTITGTRPTNTPTLSNTPTTTRTPTITPTAFPGCGTGADYVITTATAAIVPGTTDIGNHGDDVVTTIALPFTFRYYGVNFANANVSSNGNLQFASTSTSFSNVCLPTATFNYPMLPYWDDLRTDGTTGEGIFTSVTTDPSTGGQVFNIEWRSCIRTGATVCSAIDTNFEVRLLQVPRADGTEFEFVYGSMLQNGSGATVGVQRATGISFTQYSCNTASLSNGLDLMFKPFPCSQPTFTPTSTVSPTFTITPFPTCGPGGPYVYIPDNGLLTPATTDIGNHGDDVVTTITLPFTFRFYGLNFTSATASSNGTLQFASTSTAFTNVCLPSATFNYPMLPYWDDQRTDCTGCGIFTSLSGSPGSQVFTIEWRTCAFNSACTGINTNYEVQLFETPLPDGTEFQMVYGDVTGDGSSQTRGNSATVGVQRSTGPDFTQYECNTLGTVQSGLVLKWRPFGCGEPTFTVSPTRTTSATSTITNTPLPTNTPTATFTPRSQSTCGPDANYTMITSTTGSLVPAVTDTGNHGDDEVTAITLPFAFNFYGLNFATANVSSNGNLQFLSSDGEFLNTCLPDPTFNYPMLPYWDDLRTDVTGTVPSGIFTNVSGPVGNRIFDIEWRAVYFRAVTETVNFEIRLFENPGPGNVSRFDFVYGADPEGGSSATVGAQRKNGTGNFYVQYECLTAGSVFPGLQITFTLPDCPTPTPVVTATPACTPYAVGHLTWQTVPQPNSRNIQPLTVTIKSGVTEVNYSTTADASGFFTVPLGAFPSGGAEWRVKGPRHLASCGVFNVTGCGPSNFEAGTQRGGDSFPTTSGNNIINVNDFNTLKAQFGQGGCGLSSDFDFNCVVNVSDFNIQKGNFGQAGCGPVLTAEDFRKESPRTGP